MIVELTDFLGVLLDDLFVHLLVELYLGVASKGERGCFVGGALSTFERFDGEEYRLAWKSYSVIEVRGGGGNLELDAELFNLQVFFGGWLFSGFFFGCISGGLGGNLLAA